MSQAPEAVEKLTKKKKPRKPLSEENKPGRYDERNTLNDLTGKDWLLLTASFWFSEPTTEDKLAYAHPAPFMVRDIEKLVSLFTKKGMTVLDPFVGSGTTLLAANKLGRRAIGIDLNSEFKATAKERLKARGFNDYEYIVGDANKKIETIDPVDYIVTSPPYHNILRNGSKGTRHNNGKLYRMGAREGVQYYSDHKNDLGNFDEYDDFIKALKEIMGKAYLKLKAGKYCSIIISDFTVNKVEVCVQADVVRIMREVGFVFCGTTVLLQTVKPLYPFGYPYAYKINHHHQNIMNFMKPKPESLNGNGKGNGKNR
ncbi:MAG TPA: DNA methyltransferase [Pyrinomonadaceae bacterium]|nr:DNA methyltransferase [Pyrinomonadaceae bacterium]